MIEAFGIVTIKIAAWIGLVSMSVVVILLLWLLADEIVRKRRTNELMRRLIIDRAAYKRALIKIKRGDKTQGEMVDLAKTVLVRRNERAT